MSNKPTKPQRAPTDEELASELGITVEQYQQGQREIQRSYLEIKMYWMEMGVSLEEIEHTPLNILLSFQKMMKRSFP